MLPLQGTQVQSLVGELRSHKPPGRPRKKGAVKKKKKKLPGGSETEAVLFSI